MLYKLLSRIDRDLYENQVISLLNKGPMAEKIEALGVTVDALNMPRSIPDPRGIWRLSRMIRNYKPDAIQTWMYHADLLGGLATRISRINVPVIWGVHHTNLVPGQDKKTTIVTAKLCAKLSRRIPAKIVCCSMASEETHAKIGYDKDKMLVIPNGFDLEAFCPDREARGSVRQELGIDKDALFIGMAGRFNPQKDHNNLIQAAKLLKNRNIKASFVLCGQDIDWQNEKLSRWIRQAGLEDIFFLLGPRSDMPKIDAALDICVLSSSHGEAFPLVLGEAMACEVPCVATDVGDCADIVGNTGRIVPPRNPEALAGAIHELVEMGQEGRKQLGRAARKRVEEKYELGKVVRQYEELYRSVCETNKE